MFDGPISTPFQQESPDLSAPLTTVQFEPIPIGEAILEAPALLNAGSQSEGVTLLDPISVPAGLFVMPSSLDAAPQTGGTATGNPMPFAGPATSDSPASPPSSSPGLTPPPASSAGAMPEPSAGANFVPEGESTAEPESPTEPESTAPAAIVSGLFNTGVGDNGFMLDAGDTDTHYQLVSSPSTTGSDAKVVDPTGFPLINGPWAANSSDSSWISPLANGETSVPEGDYVYHTTFTLQDAAAGFELTGRWATDNDGVNILLNGVQFAGSTPYEEFQFHAIAVTSGFIEGVNTLEFRVHNGSLPGDPATGNPTGLRVEFDQTDRPVPVAGPGMEYVPTLFSTGVDDNRDLAGAGTDDVHWTIQQSPDQSQVGQQAYVLPAAWPIGPNGPWAGEDSNSDSQWITAGPYGGSSAMPGDYVYSTTFDLTGYDLSTVTIDGKWASDNDGQDILVNGQSTGNTTPFEDFQFHNFSISTSLFVAGVNTIGFKVHNGGPDFNPTGLRVQFEGLTKLMEFRDDPKPKGMDGKIEGARYVPPKGEDLGQIVVLRRTEAGHENEMTATFRPRVILNNLTSVISNINRVYKVKIDHLNFFQIADTRSTVAGAPLVADIPGYTTAGGNALKYNIPFVDPPKGGLKKLGVLQQWTDDKPWYYDEAVPTNPGALGNAYNPNRQLAKRTQSAGLTFSDTPDVGKDSVTTFTTWVVGINAKGGIEMSLTSWTWEVTGDADGDSTITSYYDKKSKQPDADQFNIYLKLFGK